MKPMPISRLLLLPAAVVVLVFGLAGPLSAYPLDGYEDTGIRRVEGTRLVNEGEMPGRKQPPGALLPTASVDLRLLDQPGLELPLADRALTAQIVDLLGRDADRYGIAILDLSDPANPRYAEHRGDYRQNVGSVGKLIVALALFQAMADIWPDENDRLHLLKERVITANEFIRRDHHTVRIFDPETRELTRRALKEGDQARLWEYLDWMLSPSSNAAAAMLMHEAMLMRKFGALYPPSEQEAERFFDETPRKELTAHFERTFFEPLTRNGFDIEQIRQASFFSRTGKAKVPGPGSSFATARQLIKLGLRMEQGRLVDAWSSRQLKRLVYATESRIRYASAPVLGDSAVYFKSGSLYSCRDEPGFKCGKYKGNAKNYMNSFAIIETPAGERRLHYMVMLISNVLRKNSAYDHQKLASRIHELIDGAHPPLPADPGPGITSIPAN
jgi:hypothetical protein